MYTANCIMHWHSRVFLFRLTYIDVGGIEVKKKRSEAFLIRFFSSHLLYLALLHTYLVHKLAWLECIWICSWAIANHCALHVWIFFCDSTRSGIRHIIGIFVCRFVHLHKAHRPQYDCTLVCNKYLNIYMHFFAIFYT